MKELNDYTAEKARKTVLNQLYRRIELAAENELDSITLYGRLPKYVIDDLKFKDFHVDEVKFNLIIRFLSNHKYCTVISW